MLIIGVAFVVLPSAKTRRSCWMPPCTHIEMVKVRVLVDRQGFVRTVDTAEQTLRGVVEREGIAKLARHHMGGVDVHGVHVVRADDVEGLRALQAHPAASRTISPLVMLVVREDVERRGCPPCWWPLPTALVAIEMIRAGVRRGQAGEVQGGGGPVGGAALRFDTIGSSTARRR
jgi:hypothetical protein